MRNAVDTVVSFDDVGGLFQQSFDFLLDEFIFVVIVAGLVFRFDAGIVPPVRLAALAAPSRPLA